MDHHAAVTPILADLQIIACPGCGAPAEIEWSAELASTDGPIEHVKVLCVRRHVFLMPSAE